MKKTLRIGCLAMCLMMLTLSAFAEKTYTYDEKAAKGRVQTYEFLDFGLTIGVPADFHHEWPTDDQMHHGVLAVYWNSTYTRSVGVIDATDYSIRSLEDKMRELKADPDVASPEYVTCNGLRAIAYSIPQYDSFYIYIRTAGGRAMEIEYTPLSDSGLYGMRDLLLSALQEFVW